MFNEVIPGSEFDSDFAPISRFRLKSGEADVYINLTTGTYHRRSGCNMPIRLAGGRTMILRVSGRGDRSDHLSRCRYVRACSVGGRFYPLNALCCTASLRAAREELEHRSGQRFRGRGCRLFRHRNAIEVVYISLAAEQENWDVLASGEVVEAQRRYLARYALGRRKSGETEVYVGLVARRRQSSSCGTRATKPQRLSLDVGQALRFPEMRPRTLRRRAVGKRQLHANSSTQCRRVAVFSAGAVRSVTLEAGASCQVRS